MKNIPAKQHPLITAFLRETNYVQRLSKLSDGPTHIIFPELFSENVQRFRQSLEKFDLSHQIFYALKANPTIAFAREAYAQGIGIDVASYNELRMAFSAGFCGCNTICNGPKNNEYLLLALQQECTISIDSIDELERIFSISKHLDHIEVIKIIIRIADPVHADRIVQWKTSRFGVPRSHLQKVYTLLQSDKRVRLKGFHFHVDGYPADIKAGFVLCLIDCLVQAREYGFNPSVINIGGGFRRTILQNPADWNNFIQEVEEQLVSGKKPEIWGNYHYCLEKTESGNIKGREKAQEKGARHDVYQYISELFESSEQKTQRPLSKIINDLGIKIFTEPGTALLDNTGITLLRIIGVKQAANGENLILVDANIYNLSLARIQHYIADPILVSENTDTPFCSGFIVGNLCQENDVLIRRKIYFNHTPQAGDVLCFLNTAAYYSSFEDASPHLHPRGESFVYVSNQEGTLLRSDLYQPLLLSL